MEQQDVSSESTESTTLGSRIINIFASPSEAFLGLNDQPTKASHWVIPYLIFIVFSVLITYVIYVNEPLRSQVYDLQARALQEQVEKGDMPQQQADQIINQMEGASLGIFLLFGSVPAIFFVNVFYFGAALFLWLTGKFALKAPAKYGKYLEIYGLASWVGVLGYFVTILMIMGMNSLFATPSLGLLVSDYDAMNTTHKFISAVNVFSVWMAVVTGIGLSKVTGKSAGMGIGIVLGLWVVWVAVGVPLGLVR